MMQMISGTIKNAVKLDMLTQNWEQKKKSGNVLSKQDRNKQADMTPEQKMLEQFKKDLENNREQSKNTDIANKIMYGEDLTPEEEQYLASNNPGQLSNYRQMKAEKHAYEEKLRKCKTKDEVQRLKTNTMGAYLSELKAAPSEAKTAKAMEIIGKVRNVLKAETKFIKSGDYEKLPTEADEAIEKAEERSQENEEIIETIKESTESSEDEAAEEELSENDVISDNEIKGENHKNDKIIADELKKIDSKVKKKDKDPLEEIEEICKRYIPELDRKAKNKNVTPEHKTTTKKTGGNIDIIL